MTYRSDMGRMKETLPDYPIVQYVYDQPIWSDADVKKWAMSEAMIKVTQYSGEPLCNYFVRVREYAQEMINATNKLKL